MCFFNINKNESAIKIAAKKMRFLSIALTKAKIILDNKEIKKLTVKQKQKRKTK